MRQTELHLTDADRATVDEIRSKGVHHAREVNRAHALSCLDRGVPEAQILQVLGMGRTALWRTRSAYVQAGVELAVYDVAGRVVRPCVNRELEAGTYQNVVDVRGVSPGVYFVGLRTLDGALNRMIVVTP